MECRYCGNDHAPTELCRARRVNRRSFLGLFGAGMAGIALAPGLVTTAPPTGVLPVANGGIGITGEAFLIRPQGAFMRAIYAEMVQLAADMQHEVEFAMCRDARAILDRGPVRLACSPSARPLDFPTRD